MNGWEFSVLDFIQAHFRSDVMDAVMKFITGLGNAGIIWIILCLLLLISRKHRRTGVIMMIALIVDLILCNFILKPLAARVRPYDVNSAVRLIIAAQHDFSFPSGHAAASFTATTVLFLNKEKFWPAALVLSILISFSRLYLYVHYPTDVLGGVAVGLICGLIGYVIVNKIWKKRTAR